MKPRAIELNWMDQAYSVDVTMEFIAEVETGLPVGKVFHYLANPQETNYSSVAAAYASALRYVGCNVSDNDVYEELFSRSGVNVVLMIKKIAELTFPPKSFSELFDKPEKKS